MPILQCASSKIVRCHECVSKLSLEQDLDQRQGIGARLKIVCNSAKYASVDFDSTEKQGQYYPINRAAVLASRAIGNGRAAAEKVFSIMRLGDAVSNASRKNHNANLLHIAKEIADENMKETGNEVYDCFSSIKSHAEPISERFSFDCSWNTKGWQGKEGVVAAISEGKGKITPGPFGTEK